jgi:Holliday junction resolvase RusA-like endonuclease
MPISNEQFNIMQEPSKCVKSSRESERESLKIVIPGQIRGGKNNMIVTRTGLHFPRPEWAKWRDAAVIAVKEQLPRGFKPFTESVSVRLEYVAGDKRRRDFPAICDSIWHVLEKAGVVTDDSILWISDSSRAYDKDSPRATITFLKP